jgi:type II pantothenate kinase
MRAAIYFGITNTDVVIEQNGELLTLTRPTTGDPSPALVAELLQPSGSPLAALRGLAVTGGRHRLLPDEIFGVPLTRVGEITAIGRGGQAVAEQLGVDTSAPLLIVSAGSGTATVFAHAETYQHVSGSGVGGGTLLGLSRLLLHTVEPKEIDALALAGNPNGADLALKDVITGPIGSLPPEATAVNFGRVGKFEIEVSRQDLAAALVILVGQVIGVTAVNSARARGCQHIVVIGHLIDMPSIRQAIQSVSVFYATPILLAERPGYATALGALKHLNH